MNIKLKNLLTESPDRMNIEFHPKFGDFDGHWEDANAVAFAFDKYGNLFVYPEGNHPDMVSHLHSAIHSSDTLKSLKNDNIKVFIKDKTGFSNFLSKLKNMSVKEIGEFLFDIDTLPSIRRKLFNLTGRAWLGNDLNMISVWASSSEKDRYKDNLPFLIKSLNMDPQTTYIEFSNKQNEVVPFSALVGGNKVKGNKTKIDYSKAHTETNPEKRKALQKQTGIGFNPVKNIGGMSQWQRNQLKGVAEEQSSKLKDLLNEIPDDSHFKGKPVYYTDDDSVPFIVYDDIIVYNPAKNHKESSQQTHRYIKAMLDDIKRSKELSNLSYYKLKVYPNYNEKELSDRLFNLKAWNDGIEGRLFTDRKLISWWENDADSIALTKKYINFIKHVMGGNPLNYHLELHQQQDKGNFIPLSKIFKNEIQTVDATDKEKKRLQLLKQYHETPPGPKKEALKKLLFKQSGDVDMPAFKKGYDTFHAGYSVAESERSSKLKDLISGGLADNKSLKDIAKKHAVSQDQLRNQLALGIKIEMEHTDDKKIAKEIALDHLYEIPDYYSRLKKMEDNVE